MKNSVVLHITRGKSHLDIVHNGEVIGRIEVAERNRTNQASLKLRADAEVTRYIIAKEEDETKFNREEFNR